MCLCRDRGILQHVFGGSVSAEAGKGQWTPGSGARDGPELPDVENENKTWSLCKTSS